MHANAKFVFLIMINKKILLIGVLTGPKCGELSANLLTKEILKSNFLHLNAIDINFLDSIDQASTNGQLSLKKIIKISRLAPRLFFIFNTDIVYLVPGLSVFGIIKTLHFSILAKILRKKIVYHFHGSKIFLLLNDSRKNFALKILLHFFLSLPSKLFVCSSILAKELSARILRPNVVMSLPNPVNVPPIINQTKFNEKVLNVIYFSNLMKTKGIYNYLRVVENMNTNNNVRFHIAGGGNDIYIIRKIREIENKYGNLEFHGLLEGQAKNKLLNICSIMVLPTMYAQEALPISILECMSYGMAIISSKIGGIEEVVSHNKNGFLVDPKNICQITSFIDRLLNDRIILEEFSKSSRNCIIERHNIDDYARKLLSIFYDN